ncbi:sulfatase-like hydrolase/transferase [Massilia sp. CCM 8733]|uniref:Sulfatase-like hydrolase/transferase n=1 Tax=Massilia mucilaginosa TaxID=2609282 RepID=A0ABX0P0R2_9BURK|nr:phosphoethanolamine transferase [Massilia mucilaginosa]NHZ92797.1 sulfatase-like hydrolase/transferase [Massilia mucilaginosa]
MRHLLRPAPLYLLLTYAALSAIPFFPMLLGKRLDRPWQVLGIEAVAWVAVWALFKRPAWFHWLLIPAFLALPTELYLFSFYGQSISTHHLGIIAETSPKEALEFLGKTVWLMLAVMAAVIAWWVTSFQAARRARDLDWDDGSRWLTLGLLAIGAGLWAYGHEFGVAPRAPATSAAPAAGKAPASASKAGAGAAWTGWKSAPLPHWAVLPLEFGAFAQTWPFGITARGVDFYKERKHLASLVQRNSHFRFGAHQAAPDTEPEIVVMVLGESSRFDRWSLNGYARETNPLLGKETKLVTLPDVVTSVSATRLSVPVIISRKPATQSLKDGFAEKSFLTAYKEAGFKTYWLSNQISFGEFDTPVSVFAKEAEVIQFLNLGGFTNSSNFDEILFDPLRNAIADPAPKKLIVLHSLGSHWNYSQRYPKQFDRWQPSLFGIDKPVYSNPALKTQLNNSYDSTILYTDWFLASVIGQLKASQQRSAMLYVSDHGQALYDNSCKLAFHGHNTQYDFHVPALLWYSDQYQARYPGKVEQLRRHRGARLATENMFHTLLDLADIRYPGERLEWSFVNPGFRQHKRYVDSYGWSDYDNATFKGDCREVIDKGTPLKRDK